MRKFFFLFFSMLGSVAYAQPDNVITVNLENAAVQRYMNEVLYVNHDDVSLINDYNVEPPIYRDRPNPAVVPIPQSEAETLLLVYGDSADYCGHTDTMTVNGGTSEAEIYNLVPQRTYYYKVTDGNSTLTQGEIHTEGQVRMIYVPGTNNIRDLGGWKTADGKRIKYGKLYRGAELNGRHVVDSTNMEILKRQLEIKAEIDMRASYDTCSNISAFGYKSSTTGITDYMPYYYTSDSGQLYEHLGVYTYLFKWKREFNFIVNNLKRNRNVYFHCVWGADRTGYLALLLEGLLGVEYDGLIKDYELTTLISGGRTKDKIEAVIDTIMTLEGSTMQDKFNTFFVNCIQAKQEDIDYFRSAMLEDAEPIDDNQQGQDNPPTAIRSCRHDDDATETLVTYDLRGRQLRRTAAKGLVIEKGHDGKMRKIIR